MCCILVICLLGTGGMFPEAKSTDSILQINEKYISKDDPAFFEGDIFTPETHRKFSPKLLVWPRVGDAVKIPYNLSDAYGELHRKVIFEAFSDLEASTCINFVERTTEQNYINILPGNGCYSSVGRVGKRQVVSLAFECVQKGKGVVLHELMHVIGFWHEHSRADRDEYVIIHWKALISDYLVNFCKYDTTNRLVKYDYGSILHYSSRAFSVSGAVTIEARDSRAHIGQRIKLSDSDILRVNRLYHCPQYVFSDDYSENLDKLNEEATGVADCPDKNPDNFASLSATVSAKSVVSAHLSLKEELNSVSPPPTEESRISPISVYSSSPESKPGSASTFPSKEPKFEPTGFMYSFTKEPTHQLPDDQTFTTVVSAVGLSVTNLELNTSDGTKTVSTIEEPSVTEAILQTSIFMSKSPMANVDITKENTTLQTSTSSEIQQQTPSEDAWISSGSGEDLNASHNQDDECGKENLHLINVRKRSLAGKTLGSWSEHHPRWIHGNKLRNSYSNRRKSWEDIKPFCGFEHGFCGWKQSTEDDLDWRLSWGSLNVNTVHFRPEGFHLSLKSRPEDAVSGQKALLLRPVVQPANCISFWYSSRHSIMGTLNVYIASSGREEKLLWSYGGQDHVKWTKAQIMLPSHLLYGNAHVVVEGIMALSGTSNLAIDDLYVGQCR